MPKPIQGFTTFQADHCVTGSMRHIYDFHGYPISEDLLLGLGAGVGFIYLHSQGMLPFLVGRASSAGGPQAKGFESAAGRRTGVEINCRKIRSASKAEKALVEVLSKSPAMVLVDMGLLPYFRLPEGYHFGGHAVVVAGIDRDARRVVVADRDRKLHPLGMDTLAQARGSKHRPFPPQNALYIFDFSARRPPTRKETWQAIQEAASGMLRPPVSNLGVQGIHKASGDIRKWPGRMSRDGIRYACFNAAVCIDARGGTGGGMFRYMYARFLKEAEAITGKSRLTAVGEQMRQIGDAWEKVAHLFRESASKKRPGGRLAEAASLMTDLALQEEQAWSHLEKLSLSALGKS